MLLGECISDVKDLVIVEVYKHVNCFLEVRKNLTKPTIPVSLESSVSRFATKRKLTYFLTFLRLSMAEPKSPSEADIITRGRLLSLELLQALLESAGKGFPVVPCFVEALKSYLPYALLRASVTPLAPVFERAASLFAGMWVDNLLVRCPRVHFRCFCRCVLVETVIGRFSNGS
jgi:hypothetical protein